MDGALTTQPRAPAVLPVRNTSASSMQSPPASADATRVSILSPGFARPRRSSEVNVVVDEFTQTQVLGQGDRKEQPSIGHQTVVVKGIWIRSGCSSGSILYPDFGPRQ